MVSRQGAKAPRIALHLPSLVRIGRCSLGGDLTFTGDPQSATVVSELNVEAAAGVFEQLFRRKPPGNTQRLKLQVSFDYYLQAQFKRPIMHLGMRVAFHQLNRNMVAELRVVHVIPPLRSLICVRRVAPKGFKEANVPGTERVLPKWHWGHAVRQAPGAA